MHKRPLRRESLSVVDRARKSFGGTKFPFYTTEITSHFFTVFINTSHRPLVYRNGINRAPQIFQYLRDEVQRAPNVDTPTTKAIPIRNEHFVWSLNESKSKKTTSALDEAEKMLSFYADGLSEGEVFADALKVTCGFNKAYFESDDIQSHTENNNKFDVDSLQQNKAKKVYSKDIFFQKGRVHVAEILAYPGDLIFLPANWSASIEPFFKAESSIMDHCKRMKVLHCRLEACMQQINRRGHFMASESRTFRSTSEKEFIRKVIHKQSRWDEISEGARKVY